MPEACFLCLDNTDYMRNGDYFPTRHFAMLEVANLLVSAKMQLNAENTIGFLTSGGDACKVFETLTMDLDRVLASLTEVKMSGRVSHFSAALRIAALALSHRANPLSEKRIVVFVGSPIKETVGELEALAKKLRKDEVAVDVILFGAPENEERLSLFVSKVEKQGNSVFIHIPAGANLTAVLMDSQVFTSQSGQSSDRGPGGMPGFQVDPNVDPELEMALRMSMEAHNNSTAASGGAGPVATPALSPFDEELQRAIQLSLMDVANANQGSAPEETKEEEKDKKRPRDEDSDEEFQSELQKAIEESKKNWKDDEEAEKS